MYNRTKKQYKIGCIFLEKWFTTALIKLVDLNNHNDNRTMPLPEICYYLHIALIARQLTVYMPYLALLL